MAEYRMHVLVVRLSALGDVAILQPVVKAWATANRDVLFTVAAPPLLEPLFRGEANIDYFPCKKQSSWQLFKLFRQMKPSVVLDMHYVNRTIVADLLLQLCGVRVAHIKKDHRRKRQLTKGRIKSPLKPSWQRYDDVLRQTGLTAPQIDTTPFTLKNHTNNHRRIGIAPFAQHRGKIWSSAQVQKLIALLAENKDYTILLFGSRDEAPLLEQWAEGYNNVESRAGKQKFDDELQIIATLDCMVSMDSANMHFASCMGVRVVSIWGATHTAAGFYGFRQDEQWRVEHKLDCRPCSVYGNKACRFGDYRCLSNISAEEVYQKVLQVLH